MRLESLALTNEDKDYMRSLIENNKKAELKCTGGDDSNLTSPQMKTREDEKTLWKKECYIEAITGLDVLASWMPHGFDWASLMMTW